ncbi:MAG TPA: 50S ribosomal protein L20 [bacterium]
MPRAKGGFKTRRRRKKYVKAASGYWGKKGSLYTFAREAVEKSLQYAFRDRKAKKRDFRSLWIIRINAAVRPFAISYSKFINGLNKAKVGVDRKLLADLAVNDPAAFQEFVKVAKENL